MLRDWTFGRKIALGFGITALALIVVGVVGYRSARALIANDELVAHSQQVRRGVAALQAKLIDAETGQRGFLITGDDAFLEPYKAGLPEIEHLFTELKQLTSDNAGQQNRLDQLRPLIDTRLTQLKDVIDQRRAQKGIDQAAATIQHGDGKRTMDQIRSTIGEIDREEASLLDSRRRDAEASTELTTSVIVYGSLGALVLTVLVAWLIASSLGRQIGTAVQSMQSSSTELQAAANQQASGSKEQATAMAQIATTMTELLATSRQIAESSQRVSQLAGQTATSARSGGATVAKGNEASVSMRKQVDQIVGHMVDLGKRSQQVGAVLDIVAELAEQTNILAINATIEAAGAGEAGRRFGVVADEIRKLADRVGASTKEIRGMIEDVRGAVNTTVMVTEAGSKAVDTSASTVIDMAVSFQDIAGLVVTITEAAREIELSTKQQASAVEQVNAAIGNVAQAARETEASATQTLQTASQLTTLSSDLGRIVSARA